MALSFAQIRAAYKFLVFGIVDSFHHKVQVSTKAGQAQFISTNSPSGANAPAAR